MTMISHREMRNNSADILRRVEAGESFTVTNKGAPVARISPLEVSTLDELRAKGQLRDATGTWESLPGPTQLADVSTEEIIADVRGYDRGY